MWGPHLQTLSPVFPHCKNHMFPQRHFQICPLLYVLSLWKTALCFLSPVFPRCWKQSFIPSVTCSLIVRNNHMLSKSYVPSLLETALCCLFVGNSCYGPSALCSLTAGNIPVPSKTFSNLGKGLCSLTYMFIHCWKPYLTLVLFSPIVGKNPVFTLSYVPSLLYSPVFP